MASANLTALAEYWTWRLGVDQWCFGKWLHLLIFLSLSSSSVHLRVPSQWLPLSRSNSWLFCHSTPITFHLCSSDQREASEWIWNRDVVGWNQTQGVGPCFERHLMGFSPPPRARTAPSEATRNIARTQREYSRALCSRNTSLLPTNHMPHFPAQRTNTNEAA